MELNIRTATGILVVGSLALLWGIRAGFRGVAVT